MADEANPRGAPSIRVLCVDDDEQARAVLSEALVSQGYHVEVAVDVASALALLRADRFDLIVTDYFGSPTAPAPPCSQTPPPKAS